MYYCVYYVNRVWDCRKKVPLTQGSEALSNAIPVPRNLCRYFQISDRLIREELRPWKMISLLHHIYLHNNNIELIIEIRSAPEGLIDSSEPADVGHGREEGEVEQAQTERDHATTRHQDG